MVVVAGWLALSLSLRGCTALPYALLDMHWRHSYRDPGCGRCSNRSIGDRKRAYNEDDEEELVLYRFYSGIDSVCLYSKKSFGLSTQRPRVYYFLLDYRSVSDSMTQWAALNNAGCGLTSEVITALGTRRLDASILMEMMSMNLRSTREVKSDGHQQGAPCTTGLTTSLNCW